MGEAPEVIIDVMKPGDLDQVLAIENASFTLPWSRRLFEQELRRPAVSTLLVAYSDVRPAGGETEGRTIVGYVVFWVVADEMHILNLAVAPERRRTGIGKRLVLTALRHAFGLGARKAFLEVRASNTAAQKLYASLGFAGVGLRRGYYDMPLEDAVIMAIEGGAFKTLVEQARRSEE